MFLGHRKSSIDQRIVKDSGGELGLMGNWNWIGLA